MDLVVLPDSGWAGLVADHFRHAVHAGDRLCLATGATTRPLYREIARRGGIGPVEIFLLDEFGGLATDDPGRCLSMLRRDLLRDLAEPPVVHSPDVDAADPAAAASQYGATIRSGPLDLAVVGLGINGHVGMNEPGSEEGSSTRVVELASTTVANASRYGTMDAPTWGITVGISELMAARRIWLVVTGAHKRDILEEALSAPIGPDLPATFLREHPALTVYADLSAAGGLEDVTFA